MGETSNSSADYYHCSFALANVNADDPGFDLKQETSSKVTVYEHGIYVVETGLPHLYQHDRLKPRYYKTRIKYSQIELVVMNVRRIDNSFPPKSQTVAFETYNLILKFVDPNQFFDFLCKLRLQNYECAQNNTSSI